MRDAYEDVFSDAISRLSLHLQTTTGGAGRGYQPGVCLLGVADLFPFFLFYIRALHEWSGRCAAILIREGEEKLKEKKCRAIIIIILSFSTRPTSVESHDT